VCAGSLSLQLPQLSTAAVTVSANHKLSQRTRVHCGVMIAEPYAKAFMRLTHRLPYRSGSDPLHSKPSLLASLLSATRVYVGPSLPLPAPMGGVKGAVELEFGVSAPIYSTAAAAHTLASSAYSPASGAASATAFGLREGLLTDDHHLGVGIRLSGARAKTRAVSFQTPAVSVVLSYHGPALSVSIPIAVGPLNQGWGLVCGLFLPITLFATAKRMRELHVMQRSRAARRERVHRFFTATNSSGRGSGSAIESEALRWTEAGRALWRQRLSALREQLRLEPEAVAKHRTLRATARNQRLRHTGASDTASGGSGVVVIIEAWYGVDENNDPGAAAAYDSDADDRKAGAEEGEEAAAEEDEEESAARDEFRAEQRWIVTGPSPPDQPLSAEQLDSQSAELAVWSGGRLPTTIDARIPLITQQSAVDGSLAITVSSRLRGLYHPSRPASDSERPASSDPEVAGSEARLYVQYRYGGRRYEVSARDGETLRLPDVENHAPAASRRKHGKDKSKKHRKEKEERWL
jgi:hypothetical protein